jgi:D-glucosaminate-6-phosphate ammonia-lyase
MTNRRRFIQTMSSLPLAGSVVAATETATSGERDYFKELGVRPFINAAGTYTALTATLMQPEVVAAINYASKMFVPLNELHDAVGKRIAELVGSEGAMVTSGAFAALTLGTAACLTGKNPDWIKRIPDLSGTEMKSEVIIQKSHRYGYDHGVRNCGVKMIEVETAEELERAVSERTATLHFFCDAEPKGKIKAEQWAALGKKHNIPTFADAADVLPPTEHLTKYLKLGFDLVTFSGGKGLRGPQSTGLLLGKKHLIEAARMNASPNGDTIGRGLKVNKEEMLGLMVAVELYLKRDAKAEWNEWARRANVVAESVKDVATVKTEIYVPPIANHVPTVRIKWDKATLNLTAEAVRKQLREGTPAIELVPASSPVTAATQEVNVGIWQMQSGEVDIVAKRLKEVLRKA